MLELLLGYFLSSNAPERDARDGGFASAGAISPHTVVTAQATDIYTRHPRHSDTTGLDANEVQASMLTGLMMSRCLVCGKCVRGITHVHPPPISSYAVLRLKLRPP